MKNRTVEKKHPSFLEYLNTRGGTDEKAKVDASGDQVDMPKPKAKEDPHKTNKKGKKVKQVTESKKRRSFKEYLSGNGKLVEKPTVDAKADYHGPDPKSPEGNPTPYRAANSGSSASSNRESGFGDMGNKSLKYEPKTDVTEKTVSSWPKTKTEGFLNETKNMSLAQFTKHMIENCGCGQVVSEELPGVTAYTTGKIQPHPPEAIKYVAVLANKNENILDNIVHEIKSTGSLGKLLKSLLQHPEAFSEFSALLGDEIDGPRYARLLAKALREQGLAEAVGPPIGPKMKDDEEEEEEDPMGSLSDLDMGDEEEMDDEDMDDEEMGDEEMPDDMDDEEMGDEEMPEDDFDLGSLTGDFKMGPKPPFGKKPFGKGPMGPPSPMGDMGDEDMMGDMGLDGMDDMGDDMGPPMDDMGDEDMMGDMGDEEMPDDMDSDLGLDDMGDEEMDDEMPDLDVDDEDMEGEEDMEDEEDEEEDAPPFGKAKKKSALDNLSNAMRMFSQMRR